MAYDYINFSGLSHFFNKLKSKFSDINHTHNYAGSSSVGGVANSAVKLETARTIRTNLGSTSAASFDGSGNITPGITGTLPITNGGTGATSKTNAVSNLGLSDVLTYNSSNDAIVMPSASDWKAMAYGDGRIIAITEDGSSTNIIAYSDDLGKTWTQTTLPISSSWYNICYGDGTFVIVPYNNKSTALYSTDNGITWNSTSIYNKTMGGIVYGNGTFVAVSYSPTQGIAYSVDKGVTWKTTTSNIEKMESIAYGNGKFVTIASGCIAYSEDGISWSDATFSNSGNSGFADIAYGNGKFVIISKSYIYYSSDGINWTYKFNSLFSNAYSTNTRICFGNDKFVAMNNYGSYYSEDGITWYNKDLPISFTPTDVIYAEGRFIAIQEGSANMLFSEDGINWYTSLLPKLRDVISKDVTDDIKTLLEIPTASKMASIDNAIDEISYNVENRPVNNNILINSNFANPVNQRGQDSIDIGVRNYFIDRWTKDKNIQTTKCDGYIELARGSETDYVGFIQYIEEPMLGKTITFSVKLYDSDVINSITWNVPSAWSSEAYLESEYINNVKLVLKIDEIYKELGLVCAMIFVNINSTIKLEWAKLELGEVATPYVPLSYEEELQSCQRYYQQVYVNDNPSQYAENSLIFTSQIPHEMRIANVTIDASGVNITRNSSTITGFTLDSSATNTTVKKLYLKYDKTAHGYVIGDNIHLDGNVILDAEL